jgi:hypothetical protein
MALRKCAILSALPDDILQLLDCSLFVLVLAECPGESSRPPRHPEISLQRLLNGLEIDLCSSNSDRDTDIVDHIIVKKENIMRTLLVLGTAGLVLALGAADANAIPVLNKDATPYAVLNGPAEPVIEGRSVFTVPAANDPGPAATPRLQGRTNR